MKKTMAATFALFFALFIGFGVLYAANQQEYQMNRAEAKRNIEISRKLVHEDNYVLARTYAKKAIQANPWDKEAWSNYDSIVQALADLGEIPEFGAPIEPSAEAPSAGNAAPKLEGC